MFDITSQAAADTAPIHLKGRDGEYLYHDGQPVRIIVYGPGSKEFAAVEARQTSRALKRMQDNDGKPSAPAPEVRVAEQAEDLADLTVAFENLDYKPAAGKSGRELFKALYSDTRLGFIPPQIMKAVKDWAVFKAGSAES